MLRGASLCLVAILVGVPAWAVDKGFPGFDYRGALRTTERALNLAYDGLLTDKPPLTDSRRHYLLLLASVNEAANDALGRRDKKVDFQLTLRNKLGLFYRDPAGSSDRLRTNLLLARKNLADLLKAEQRLCPELDDKDCNLLLQLELEKDRLLKYQAETLRLALLLARGYLDRNEKFLGAAKKLGGLGYLLNNDSLLSYLAQLFTQLLDRKLRPQ